MTSAPFDITVLLPTRGRQEPLRQCLETLISRARYPENLEIMLAFDDDDRDSIDYFNHAVVPYLEDTGVSYTAMEYPRYGYNQLHRYINSLTKHSSGKWIVFWNDDAVMHTQHWDTVIHQYENDFVLLRAETNHGHPYAIFPIFPREWADVIGHVSQHPLNDAWLSQIGWLLDIVVTVPIYIEHERHDLTGKNQDATYNERKILEGNSLNPLDFLYMDYRKMRIQEAHTLYHHVKQTRGIELEHLMDAESGKVDPWAKMLAMDKNGLMCRYR